MRRGFITIVCIAMLAAAAGCSSGSTSSSSGSKNTSPRTTTTVLTAEDKQWIAAAAKGVGTSSLPGVTAAQVSCISTALITQVTVARLKVAGATLKELSDPNSDLPSSLVTSVPQATRLALGAALQACGIGRVLAPVFTEGFSKKLSDAERACVGGAISAPAHRLLVADTALSSSTLSPADAADLSNLLIACLDFGPFWAAQFKLDLSPAEQTCMNQKSKTDQSFAAALAQEFQGKSSTAALQAFGTKLALCLTPQHLLQLGKANK